MAKVILQPYAGTLEQSKSVKFEIQNYDIQETTRIRAYNISNSTDVIINGDILNLNIPISSSQETISIIFYIEEIINNKYEVKDICTVIYHVLQSEIPIFDGIVVITPKMVNLNDKCSIRLKYKANERVVFSVNDKRLNVLTDNNGLGSLTFNINDISDKSTSCVQKFSIYAYIKDDNYTTKYLTKSFLTIAPESITLSADVADGRCQDENFDIENWEPPEWCLNNLCPDGSEPPCEGILEPEIPPIDKLSGCRDDCINKKLIESACRIPNHSTDLLNNGLALHSFLSVDESVTSGDVGYNVNRVNIREDTTSVCANVLFISNVIVSPKSSGENFEIFVKEDVFKALSEVTTNPSSVDYHVLLFNEEIGYQSAEIINRKLDEYHDAYVIEADGSVSNSTINTWLFCVPAVFFKIEEPEIDLSNISKLPFITDANGEAIPTIKTTLAVNKHFSDEEQSNYVYVIAEGYINGYSQLFLYSAKVKKTGSSLSDVYGWTQLTSRGNNKNAIAEVDSKNNLHIFWESDRAGMEQIYYGSIGPSSRVLNNIALSSIVDKQADIVYNKTDAHTYISDSLLQLQDDTEYTPIPEYNTSELVANTAWDKYTGNNGAVNESTGSSVLKDLTFQVNPLEDMALSFVDLDYNALLNNLNNPSYNEEDAQQINYQLDFNVNIDVPLEDSALSYLSSNWNNEVLTDKDIDKIYENWKTKFEDTMNLESSNSPVYIYNDNKFSIGKLDRVFDKIVPLVGSYNKEDNPSDNQDFQISFLNSDNNVKHYILGVMLEKTYFIAKNIESKQEYCSENGMSLDACAGYIDEEKHTVFTGKAKFVILLKNEGSINETESDYVIVKEFPDVFDINADNNIKIIVNYNKMSNNDILCYYNIDNFDNTNVKYLCNYYVISNNNMAFAESFVSELNSDYIFNIGFGCPYGGYYLTDKMPPYKLNIFDDVDLNFTVSDIEITTPKYDYNSDIISLPNYVVDLTHLYVDDINENIDLLKMNLDVTSLAQMPVTLEGICKSPKIDIGLCNDIHLVWQSNRNKYWNIYSSNTVNKLDAFKYDTQITDTISNSIKPAISVNRNGTRMITWHDNRNGKYEVFAARAMDGYECTQQECESIMLNNFGEELISCTYSDSQNINEDGAYHFILKFYTDNNLTKLYKEISSSDSIEGWYLNGVSFEQLCSYDQSGICLGVSLVSGQEVDISYLPKQSDGIFDKILYVKLEKKEL